jgi:hypothetical protein
LTILEGASCKNAPFRPLWLQSLLPKVYGDRMEVEQMVRATVSAKPMTEDEWMEKYGRRDDDGDAPTTH